MAFRRQIQLMHKVSASVYLCTFASLHALEPSVLLQFLLGLAVKLQQVAQEHSLQMRCPPPRSEAWLTRTAWHWNWRNWLRWFYLCYVCYVDLFCFLFLPKCSGVTKAILKESKGRCRMTCININTGLERFLSWFGHKSQNHKMNMVSQVCLHIVSFCDAVPHRT